MTAVGSSKHRYVVVLPFFPNSCRVCHEGHGGAWLICRREGGAGKAWTWREGRWTSSYQKVGTWISFSPPVLCVCLILMRQNRRKWYLNTSHICSTWPFAPGFHAQSDEKICVTVVSYSWSKLKFHTGLISHRRQPLWPPRTSQRSDRQSKNN